MPLYPPLILYVVDTTGRFEEWVEDLCRGLHTRETSTWESSIVRWRRSHDFMNSTFILKRQIKIVQGSIVHPRNCDVCRFCPGRIE
jgi:hypothetical protein